MTKVVILAGGRGTRLQEKTGEIPKPLLMVGDRPILQHIIDMYIRGGFRDFIIPVGYLGCVVKEYFRDNYKLSHEHEHELWCTSESGEVHILVVDTGLDTLTGGRVLRLKEYLTEPFCLTYGDGISKLNPKFVMELGQELDKNIITAVHPIPRFGNMVIAPNLEVQAFSEKIIDTHTWINGGFMYLKSDIFRFMTKGDQTNLETDVLPKIVWESSLYAFQYENYWRCCDTIRDLQQLNDDYKNGLF